MPVQHRCRPSRRCGCSPLFSVPCPGWKPPKVELGEVGVAADLAIWGVLQHKYDLTIEQRQAMFDLLVPREEATAATPSASSDGARVQAGYRPLAFRTELGTLQRWAAEFQQFFSARLNHDLTTLHVQVHLPPTPTVPRANVYAVTDALFGPGLGELPDGSRFPPNTCLIQIGTELHSETSQRMSLAHEVFHCFQEDAYRDSPALASTPAFFHEGFRGVGRPAGHRPSDAPASAPSGVRGGPSG